MIESVLKWCPHCQARVPIENFGSNKSRKDGLNVYCKEGVRADYRKNREAIYKRSRAGIVKRKYGLTMSEYQAALANGCSVCGEKEGRICLDHCHVSGKVRDALCDNCNKALGHAKDDPQRLRDLADYLERHSYSDISKTKP